jgi:hypothetical protein
MLGRNGDSTQELDAKSPDDLQLMFNVGPAQLSSEVAVGARRFSTRTPSRRLLSVHMDFLKSAVASAISKGPAFGYTFGDRVDLNDSIWTLHNGTKRVWPGFLHALGRAC